MRARFVAFAAVGVVALAGASPAGEHTVQIAKSDVEGSYLADAKGMALYVFKKDAPGKSACAGPCAKAWPPFQPEKLAAGPGLKAGDLGTISREDGGKQTTYKGMPLYYFVKDTKPGETNGHMVQEVWFLAKP